MVKLIASDLDGTILRKGAQSVEPFNLLLILFLLCYIRIFLVW